MPNVSFPPKLIKIKFGRDFLCKEPFLFFFKLQDLIAFKILFLKTNLERIDFEHKFEKWIIKTFKISVLSNSRLRGDKTKQTKANYEIKPCLWIEF